MSTPLHPHYPSQFGEIVFDDQGNMLLLAGLTVPTAAQAGFSKGALFFKIDASAGAQWYRNDGSETSCNFLVVNGGVDLSGLTATATEINAAADFPATQAVTATANGLTTGLIEATTKAVIITSASADNIATLPGIAANSLPVGYTIRGRIAATGCEIRTPDTTGETINGVDGDGTQEAALAANHGFIAIVESATGWMLIDGAATVPD